MLKYKKKKTSLFFTLMTTEISMATSYFFSSFPQLNEKISLLKVTLWQYLSIWSIQNVILHWPIALWQHNFHFNLKKKRIVENLLLLHSNETKRKKSLILWYLCHGKFPFSHENHPLTWKFLSLLYHKKKKKTFKLSTEWWF